MRSELVRGLEPCAEGTLPAGPPGESRAREGVHPPGLAEYTSGASSRHYTRASFSHARAIFVCHFTFPVVFVFVAQVKDKLPNIFECQLRLWTQWFESWCEEERNHFLHMLEERDPGFVAHFYRSVAGTARRD